MYQLEKKNLVHYVISYYLKQKANVNINYFH